MTLHIGDAREWARQLPAQSIQTIVTSPPYFGLRSYLASDHPDKAREMGAETTPDAYVAALVDLFAALRPALKDDGTLWLNLGDSYATTPSGTPQRNFDGHGYDRGRGTNASSRRGDGMRQGVPEGLKPKDLIGIPWRVALALQADGWYLRSDIIWHKPNPMPESVQDRPTRSHEYIFLLTKGARYYYDADAVREPHADASIKRMKGTFNGKRDRFDQTNPLEGNFNNYLDRPAGWGNPNGRNRRTVWTIPTRAYSGAHFATFPPALVEPCILAGSRPGDTVADPFSGSGTTWMVAAQERREFVGCDLDERARGWAAARLAGVQTRMGREAAS